MKDEFIQRIIVFLCLAVDKKNQTNVDLGSIFISAGIRKLGLKSNYNIFLVCIQMRCRKRVNEQVNIVKLLIVEGN